HARRSRRRRVRGAGTHRGQRVVLQQGLADDGRQRASADRRRAPPGDVALHRRRGSEQALAARARGKDSRLRRSRGQHRLRPLRAAHRLEGARSALSAEDAALARARAACARFSPNARVSPAGTTGAEESLMTSTFASEPSVWESPAALLAHVVDSHHAYARTELARLVPLARWAARIS